MRMNITLGGKSDTKGQILSDPAQRGSLQKPHPHRQEVDGAPDAEGGSGE